MRLYNLLVRFLGSSECMEGRILLLSNRFISVKEFKSSEILKYTSVKGYALNNHTVAGLTKFDDLNFSEASNMVGLYSGIDFPTIIELASLRNSIMQGRMKEDLIEAGLYDYCNYRCRYMSPNSWGYVWSNTSYNVNGKIHKRVISISSYGRRELLDTDSGQRCNFIPFYRF